VRNDQNHGVVLDIREDVTFSGEQGLLGLAFHPQFRDNRLAYVNYVDRSQETVIAQYEIANGVFDNASRQTVLTIEQPARNHNGGMIAFGPDGHLWIGMGDGGFANDRLNNAQDAQTLLGAMLRIDVGGVEAVPYGIPTDNPFHDGVNGAPEIWAIGLRNPWRFSFDGDQVWIADVGQNDIEEVNTVRASQPGLDFGWPTMEGTACFRSSTCDATGTVQPVAEYRHDEGCSITGGYVYRGEAIPQLKGHYFFSDFCSGFLRSYSEASGIFDWTDMVGQTPSVSGFGIGSDGELYIISHAGTVYRLDSTR
jgi:glucose/arabinose dehydrogenase